MTQVSTDPEAIARELAALGEAPASEDELALVSAGLDDQPDVATVARLTELAEPLAFDELSELETHRAWRRIEQDAAGSTQEAASAQPAATSPRRWIYALGGLAAAAAVALFVIPRGGDAGLDAAAVAEQGASVRAALDALDDGRSDSDRARDRVSAYRERLEERGG